MAHLLLIESWVRLVGGTSGLLPQRIRRMGHRFTFIAWKIDRYRSERDARGEPHPVLALADRVIEVDTNEISALCEWAAREHELDEQVVGGGRAERIVVESTPPYGNSIVCTTKLH